MITDELRKWISTVTWLDDGMSHTHKNILAIADRIDAEYERVRAESIIDMTDESMAEHGWVRLPKDADGEYIRIGDVMVYADGNTCPMKVVALVPPAVFITDEGPRYADMCRHYKPTVEDVLREMLNAWGELPSTATNEAIIAKYASKLRLAEEVDG